MSSVKKNVYLYSQMCVTNQLMVLVFILLSLIFFQMNLLFFLIDVVKQLFCPFIRSKCNIEISWRFAMIQLLSFHLMSLLDKLNSFELPSFVTNDYILFFEGASSNPKWMNRMIVRPNLKQLNNLILLFDIICRI